MNTILMAIFFMSMLCSDIFSTNLMYVWNFQQFLKPCSLRKVFKTPGSVSYRRLLPYLMDISKENSCKSSIFYFCLHLGNLIHNAVI